MQVKIVKVDTENIVKGKSRYTKAVVYYDYNGDLRKQTMMSFSNPEVFKRVQELIGETVEVDVGKNEAGFNEWKSITAAGAGDPADRPASVTGAAPATTRVSGSNYETREERAARQVLIVKQSSLSAAVATLAPGAKAALDSKEVIEKAQEYTDWVFGNEQEFDDVPL